MLHNAVALNFHFSSQSCVLTQMKSDKISLVSSADEDIVDEITGEREL
jgi:hypothetical protein